MSASTITDSFRQQADWCERLGSPFTARLCKVLAETIDASTGFGRRVLAWPDATLRGDLVPLRCCGGLHWLVRSHRAENLGTLYPPREMRDPESLAQAVRATILEHDEILQAFLDSPPQTNEVMRSGILLGGFLHIAQRFGLPLALFELGSSAGLNLGVDLYAYDLGSGLHWGDMGSPVRIETEWTGPHPRLDTPVEILARNGNDLRPLDAASQTDRDRLLAYVWPDQIGRLKRIEAALDLAAQSDRRIEHADAADWLEQQRLEMQGTPRKGIASVIFHSIFWQYLPPQTRGKLVATLSAWGAVATREQPLAWLRMESEPEGRYAELRVTLWPGEEQILLARADFHGRHADWL